MLCSCGKKEEKVDEGVPFENIEAMAANSVFNVNWHSQDGDFMAGTSFVYDSEKHGEKLLVTAFHYFWPDNAVSFTGTDLESYVTGGELYDIKDRQDIGARIKKNLVILDADAVPNIEKDCAAFTLSGADNIPALELSDRIPEKGETLYMLARLWDGEVQNENCVYECIVVRADKDVIKYTVSKMYGSTMGASGAPLVDKYGKVVGMHMAGDDIYFYGHSTASFEKQLEYGFVSEN